MDTSIPCDGLQGGQTLKEVMDSLKDSLDMSSRMDVEMEFKPDYYEDSNSDTEDVELQDLDPKLVDSLLGVVGNLEITSSSTQSPVSQCDSPG
jgi:hypothetical protein